MKKFSILLPMIALIIGVAASAFTAKENKHLTGDRYHYKLTTQTGIFDAGNWEPADPSYPECDGNGLPCVIAIEGDLQDFLTTAENNGGVNDVKMEAISLQP